MKKKFSEQMHDETERPGQLFPLDTHQIIRHRYEIAATLAEKKSVLEVGAGHGIGAKLLNASASYYVAGEFSQENMTILKAAHNHILSVQFDAHKLPFKENTFDLIVTLAMIYYLDLPIFLSQAHSILKPGGCLFFCTSNKDVPGFVPSPFTTRYYSIPELNDELKKQGFLTTFKGAFPAAGGSYVRRRFKAGIKTTAKSIIRHLPSGERLWHRLRERQMGERTALPRHVDEIDYQKQQTVTLLPSQCNHNFRIIYGFAIKQ